MSDYQGEKFKNFLVSHKIAKTKAATLLGISRSAIYDYFDSVNMSRETVNKIINTFNTSEAEVFGISNTEIINSLQRNKLDESSESNMVNAKTIGNLAYPIEQGETPFINLSDGQYLMIMPLVSEYAYAGYLSGFTDPIYIEELPKHSIIVQKQHKGNYRAFEIVGDSMDDNTKESIPDGSIATGREIVQDYWRSKFHTHRYKDYVIVTRNDGIVIKRIIDHDVEKGIITCHSLNPDKAIYTDFKIKLKEVQQIFNIVNVSISR
ncbi:helix-turn-helix transcriptional regulator [Pedobacter cryoconitis]|uniref:LexA family transcriptional regulator n=1 Tax=Pedobacter cryoconitis TaxID=188932 RepID=UPI0016153C04|nr:S24 family peptidase [Pedobacter cryoconitis]MBB5643791.1 putative transcriptional regulator [Pedobacter cryoconitis]